MILQGPLAKARILMFILPNCKVYDGVFNYKVFYSNTKKIMKFQLSRLSTISRYMRPKDKVSKRLRDRNG